MDSVYHFQTRCVEFDEDERIVRTDIMRFETEEALWASVLVSLHSVIASGLKVLVKEYRAELTTIDGRVKHFLWEKIGSD
jgi:hypothetical protein